MDLSANSLLMIDDSAPFTPALEQTPCVSQDADRSKSYETCLMLRLPDRLVRSALMSYPGWLRRLLHALTVARPPGACKIIHIESDAYILPLRLADHIYKINSGWTTLWSEHYRIPETAVQVSAKTRSTRYRASSEDHMKNWMVTWLKTSVGHHEVST